MNGDDKKREIPSLVRWLVDGASDPASVVDRELRVVYYNRLYLQLIGLREREVANRELRGLCHSHFRLETCAAGECVSARALRMKAPVRMDEVRSLSSDAVFIVTAIPLLDDGGAVQGSVEIYRDVTGEGRVQTKYHLLLEQERKRNEVLAQKVEERTRDLAVANARLKDAFEEATRIARTDALTGLANRRTFDEQILSEVQRSERFGTVFSLVIIDLDGFKSINDSYGHTAGDAVLKRLAEVLTKATREVDLCARIGGDEFAVVLPRAEDRDALRIADRICKRQRSEGLHTTVSCGVATYPTHATSQQELLELADKALYGAKQAGRDRALPAQFFDDKT